MRAGSPQSDAVLRTRLAATDRPPHGYADPVRAWQARTDFDDAAVDAIGGTGEA
jgi:hypothetical protein